METNERNDSVLTDEYVPGVFWNREMTWGNEWITAKDVMHGIFLLPLVVIGMFGNVTSIVVLFRLKSEKSSIYLCFVALTMFDLIVIVFSALPILLNSAFSLLSKTFTDCTCKVLTWIQDVSRSVSNWTLVLLTVQRAVGILWPHRVNIMCTYGRTKLMITAILVFFSLVYSHYLYGLRAITSYSIRNNMLAIRRVCTSKNYEYSLFLDNIFRIVEMVLTAYIPFVTLVVSNIIIGRRVFQATRSNLRGTAAVDTRRGHQSRTQQSSSLIVTVFAVSVTFCVLIVPYLLYRTFDLDLRRLMEQDINYSTIESFWYSAANICYCMKSAVNFFLYILTGSKYREQCCKIFCPSLIRRPVENEFKT